MASLASIGGKVTITALSQRLVVTMPARLSSDLLKGVREEVLDRLRKLSARAVVLDMAMVAAIDTREFDALADIARMVQIMGTPALFSGLQPGVVSALIDLDVDTSLILAVRNVDDALALYEPEEPRSVDTQETDQPEQEPPFLAEGT